MLSYGYHPSAAMSGSAAPVCYGNSQYMNYAQYGMQQANFTNTGYGPNYAHFGWWPAHGQSNPAPAPTVQHQHFSRPRSARPPSGSVPLQQNVSPTHVSKESSPQCTRAAHIPSLPPEDQAERSLKRKLSTMLRDEQLQYVAPYLPARCEFAMVRSADLSPDSSTARQANGG